MFINYDHRPTTGDSTGEPTAITCSYVGYKIFPIGVGKCSNNRGYILITGIGAIITKIGVINAIEQDFVCGKIFIDSTRGFEFNLVIIAIPPATLFVAIIVFIGSGPVKTCVANFGAIWLGNAQGGTTRTKGGSIVVNINI